MTRPRPAYAHLNLRWNPFGEVPQEERAALAVVDVDAWAARMTRTRTAVQFIGEGGRGKTTRLLVLAERVPDAAYVRVHEGLEAGALTWPDAPALLVDELQLAPPAARQRLYATGAALALGTHEDLADELEAAGYATETRVLSGLEPARLVEICARRIAWARRGPGPVPTVDDEAARTLVAQHGDDVRAIEGRLYDLVQALGTPGPIRISAIPRPTR